VLPQHEEKKKKNEKKKIKKVKRQTGSVLFCTDLREIHSLANLRNSISPENGL